MESNKKRREKKPFSSFSKEKEGYKNKKKFSGNSFNKKRKSASSDKPFERKPFKKFDDNNNERPKKRFGDKPFERKPFKKFDGNNSERPKKRFGDKPFERKPFKKFDGNNSERPKKRFGDKPFERKPFKKLDGNNSERPKKRFGDKPFKKFDSNNNERPKKRFGDKPFERKPFTRKKKGKGFDDVKISDGLVRLNKYIANAGICSRREADDLITSGVIKVNDVVITELGHKVKMDDVVKYGDQTLKIEKLQYILLNKPKDYITTMDDPQERKNVMQLLHGACRERVYPVGRLDRNTTGLLLFTNDGELTKRLTHPRYGIKKIYHVVLDKNLKHDDFIKISEGLQLEDGPIKPDAIDYVGESKSEIGIEIHSGKNRIVRRIFEHLGYDVIKLDRVYFAGLTKKDLPRGEWRHLNTKEIGILKMIPA